MCFCPSQCAQAPTGALIAVKTFTFFVEFLIQIGEGIDVENPSPGGIYISCVHQRGALTVKQMISCHLLVIAALVKTLQQVKVQRSHLQRKKRTAALVVWPLQQPSTLSSDHRREGKRTAEVVAW